MSITVNPSQFPPMIQGILESLPDQKPQNTGRPTDLAGAPQAAGSSPVNAGGAPALPPPNLTAVDMMLQLTALMSKVAELTSVAQEEALKKDQTDLKLAQEKRMAEMQVYFEKMEEAGELKTGFFTRLTRALSYALKGNTDGALHELGQAFGGNVGTAIVIGVAVVGVATPVGVLAAVFLVCAAMEDEGFIPELVSLGYQLAGQEMDQEARDTAKTVAEVFKWVGVVGKTVVGISVALVGVLVAAALLVPTGGASLIVVPALVAALMIPASLPMQIESTVKGKQATDAQVEGWNKSAEADKAKAETETVMGKMKSNMTQLQDIFDALQGLISSLTKMMRQQQEGSASAAQAV